MANTATKTKKAASKANGDGFYVVQKTIGADTYLVMADSATHVEDEFTNFYTSASVSSNVVLKPPYEPCVLANLVQHNNILNQCIEAMEVNIDGTGYTLEPVEAGKEIEKDEEKRLTDFFNEPYPGQSFVQIRRKLRRDLESVGFAALEVLTNIAGEIVGLRNMDTYNLRFIKLDDPVMVKRNITRNGKDVEIQMWDRERRYMQKLGTKFFYYREYGSTRELDKDTGEWAVEGQTIPADKRASQLLMFGINPDTKTPYSIPRWINQLPSVIGSRKAEEQNLEFFDAGGLPPAIIFIQGGTVAATAAEQLRTYLSGKNKNKNRAVVVEAQSSSGSMDSAGNVKVSVERFGADKANDSMYSSYDENMEEHVRIGFRLPALFLGRTDDYNYATAVVAYMVAEEQVFQPERNEFDEVMNKTILRSLGAKTARFKSKPITLKNVPDQIQALTLVKDNVEGEQLIQEVNKIGGFELQYKEPEDTLPGEAASAAINTNSALQLEHGKAQIAAGKKPNLQVVPGLKAKKSIPQLALAYGQMNGLLAAKFDMTIEEKEEVGKGILALTAEEQLAFNQIVAAYTFGKIDHALVGLVACTHDH